MARFASGEVTFLETFEAARRQLREEDRLARARQAVVDAHVRLGAATGTGWKGEPR